MLPIIQILATIFVAHDISNQVNPKPKPRTAHTIKTYHKELRPNRKWWQNKYISVPEIKTYYY